MSSIVLHGEAGSVDDGAIAEGLDEIREACQEYKMENIFNVDETGYEGNESKGSCVSLHVHQRDRDWQGPDVDHR